MNAGHSNTINTNMMTDGTKAKSFTDSVTGMLIQKKPHDVSQDFLVEVKYRGFMIVIIVLKRQKENKQGENQRIV